MTRIEAVKLRMCLCCSAPDSTFYRLRDGRIYLVCDRCAASCQWCMEQLSGATKLCGCDHCHGRGWRMVPTPPEGELE